MIGILNFIKEINLIWFRQEESNFSKYKSLLRKINLDIWKLQLNKILMSFSHFIKSFKVFYALTLEIY